jgi:predicted nucleic acid-binding protein
MHSPRIYIDTSVIGGCFDEEFSTSSNNLFREIIEGKKIAVISDVTLLELEGASENIKNIIKKIPPENLILIYTDAESDYLSLQYIESGAISPKFADDAQHVALATIHNIDILVSWNFKHLVNFNRIMKYNAINLTNGYKTIEIRTPLEVLNDE